MINHGDQSAIVAGFAVDANALSEIDFLKPLGLTDVAVVYVSKRIPIKPYEFLNPIFKKYITSDGSDVPEMKGITIYAKFVPNNDTMIGRLLRQGMCANSEFSKIQLTRLATDLIPKSRYHEALLVATCELEKLSQPRRNVIKIF